MMVGQIVTAIQETLGKMWALMPLKLLGLLGYLADKYIL